ncbi:MAG: hypothetical protein E6R04_05640 [Spirochaetes bacterium]|nr:MAG: hypothetical protein E6R04_05640 [Spirochaetota bacterium]
MNKTQANFLIATLTTIGCFSAGILIGSAKSEPNPRHTTTATTVAVPPPSPRCSNDQNQTSCSVGNVRVEYFCSNQNSFITQRTERLLREGYTLKGPVSGTNNLGCQLFLFQRQQ